MTELLPCPFCGGESKELDPPVSGYWMGLWRIRCTECGATINGAYRGTNREAWNRRAERTCRVEVERRKLSQTQTAVVKSCSECGFEFGVEKENTFPFEVTLNAVVPPNFCPNCGAKVIGETE